jgi:hypothetical protein
MKHGPDDDQYEPTREELEALKRVEQMFEQMSLLCGPLPREPLEELLPLRYPAVCEEIEPIDLPERIAEEIAKVLRPGKPKEETRGRKQKYDWESAAIAVFGRIYRGPEPKKQAEVEELLSEWFAANDAGEPGETEIRNHAKPIWLEIQKVGN